MNTQKLFLFLLLLPVFIYSEKDTHAHEKRSKHVHIHTNDTPNFKKYLKGERLDRLFVHTHSKNEGYFKRKFSENELGLLEDELKFRIYKLTKGNIFGLNKWQQKAIWPLIHGGFLAFNIYLDYSLAQHVNKLQDEVVLIWGSMLASSTAFFFYKTLKNITPAFKKHKKLVKLKEIQKFVHKIRKEQKAESTVTIATAA
jgi:hypothetical protein